MEYSTDGETWRTLPGTTEENTVLAASTAGVGTLGGVATRSVFYRLRARLRRLTRIDEQ
ncbi:hypothetical protein [Haladaptatus halobius]|uniref:hypothetical protein n=1 Tax=Haladaptatus halobius TaxID=2884875 RepID=UPI001D0AD2A4|nr:hypothetical protein [Haladaptatus halobius]